MEILKFHCPTLLVHIILALDFLASLAKFDFCSYGKVTITRMSPGESHVIVPVLEIEKVLPAEFHQTRLWPCPGSPPLIKDP